jgi:uncharacterized protein
MRLTKLLIIVFVAATSLLSGCAGLSPSAPEPTALDRSNPQSILQAANAGNAEAVSLLGASYFDGINGFEKDFAQAARWLPAAVENGDTTAMAQMGFLYLNGLGVPANPSTAQDLISRSSKADNPLGHYYLGLMNLQGVGVPSNAAEGFRLITLAAQAGNAQAMKSLGDAYKDGQGTPADALSAMNWYDQAGAAGNPAGFFAAADMHEQGTLGTKDFTKAAKLYQQAADSGHAESMYRLAKLYQRGRGVKKDAAKGLEWLMKASEAEEPNAMREMANRYARGNGVPKDPEQAAALNEKLRAIEGEGVETDSSATSDTNDAEKQDNTARGSRKTRNRAEKNVDGNSADRCASYYPGRVLRSSRLVGAYESIVIEVREDEVVIGSPNGQVTGTVPCR